MRNTLPTFFKHLALPAMIVCAMELLSPVSLHAQTALDDEAAILDQIEYVTPEKFMTAGDESTMEELSALGLIDVTPFFSQIADAGHFAHVLMPQDLSRSVIIRYDYKLVDQALLGQVIKLPESRFLVNMRTRSDRPVSVYFEGFKQTEINRILLPIKRSRPNPSTSSLLIKMLVPSSNAQWGTIIKNIAANPRLFAKVMGEWSQATSMSAIVNCGNAVNAQLFGLFLAFDPTLFNPFSSPKARIFGLFRQAILLGREIVATLNDEMKFIERKGGVSGGRAIGLACSVLVGSVMKPLKAIVASMRAEVSASVAMSGIGVSQSARFAALSRAIQNSSEKMADFRIAARARFDASIVARGVTRARESKAFKTGQALNESAVTQKVGAELGSLNNFHRATQQRQRSSSAD